MLDDAALLQRFAAARAEDDFAELVRRHLNLVYSAALRQVAGEHQLAEEITQNVFADLARKAGTLTGHASLTGWLYTSAHYAAAKVVRGEQRRRAREQEASHMQQIHANPAAEVDWEQLQPVLDEAMHALSEADREVILQRYFERRPFVQIGARLGLTENAARMRAERALDKLRGILATRGVSTTGVALATVLLAQAVVTAPAALAGLVTSTSLAAVAAVGVTAGGGLLTVAKLKLLLSSACAVVLLVGLVWQQQVLNRLREENEALRRRQSTPVAAASVAAAKPVEETEEARQAKMELLRLRGEVGRLRRELAEQKASVAAMMTTNDNAVQESQVFDAMVNVRARIFAGTDEALESFPDNSTTAITAPEMAKLLKHLENESDSAEFQAAMRVTTRSGQQAQVWTTGSKTNISTGAVTEWMFLTDVLPTVQEDGHKVRLTLTASKLYDFPGETALVEAATTGAPFPLGQSKAMTADTVVWDGQTVALAMRLEGKKLVFFLTTTLVDLTGNPVHPATKP